MPRTASRAFLAAFGLFLSMLAAAPALADTTSADSCHSHDPSFAADCPSGTKWCGNQCQAVPIPTSTQDVNCTSCTTVCAPATPCGYPTCTAPTSAPAGTVSCSGNGSCPANGGVYSDQCSTSVGCPAGKTRCTNPNSCATTQSCPAGFTFDPCANGGLGACVSPYVVLSPGAQQGGFITVSGDVTTGGDLYMANGKAIRVDGSGTTDLNLGNWGGGATGLNVNVYGRLKVDGTAGELNINRASTSFVNRIVFSTAGTNDWQIGQGILGPGFAIKRISAPPDVGPATFYIDTSDNVGIGTATPLAGMKLDVAGTARMTGFRLTTGAAAGRVLTSDAAGTGTWQAPTGVTGSGTAGRVPRFATATSIGDSAALYATTVGLGIGTSTGTAPLTFAASTGVAAYLNPVGGSLYIGTSDQRSFEINSADGMGINSMANVYFNVDTDNGEADLRYFDFRKNGVGAAGGVSLMRLTEAGNLGIGTTAPAAGMKLDVVGTAQMTGFKMSTGAAAGRVLTSDAAGAGTWTALPAAPVTSVAGSGAGISVSPTTGAVVVSNTGVTSLIAGTGISVSGSTGAVTLSNTGITGGGTANQVPRFSGSTTLTNANITNDGSNTAIGSGATAGGGDSVAMGNFAAAPYAGSYAMGLRAKVNYYYGVAIGQDSDAGNAALGYSAGHAMGLDANATGWGSLALGDYVNATNFFSTSIGMYSTASGDSAYTFGKNLTATGTNSYTIGSGISTASPLANSTANSLAVGFNSTVPTLFVGSSAGAGTTGNVGIGTATPGSKLTVNGGKVEIGSGGQDYAPSGGNWNYTLQLNAADTSSIGFHDANASVSSIRYSNGGFTIGGDDGWGVRDLSVGGGVIMGGNQTINNSSPTIYFQDTDHYSSMIHQNSNTFYVLRGCGVNSGSWCSTKGYWPFTIDIPTNNATFGGDVNIPAGAVGMGGQSPSSSYGLRVQGPTYGGYFTDTNFGGDAYLGYGSGGVRGSGNSWGGYFVDNDEGASAYVGYSIYGVRAYGPSGGWDFYASGAGTDWGSSSSIRWKKNLEPIADPIGKVKALRGLYFDWDEEHGGGRDVGMIAEEVGEVLPEIVGFDKGAPGYAEAMDYSRLTPLLIEAVKAQQDQIDALRQELKELKAR